MTSLRGIDVIEGKPSLTAQMLAARILAAGHRIEWKHLADDRVTVRIERGDGLSEAEATWTMRDAQRAGLAGKKVWQQYPRQMLRARALTECAGLVCPDVALGLDVEVAHEETPAPAPVTVAANVQRIPAPVADEDGVVVEPEPEVVEAEVVEPAPESITKPQLRKIGALIGEVERISGGKLDRDARRALIAEMAGVDPESLESANNLSVVQASTAIDALSAMVADALDAEAGEP
jgi:hypothetical protein